MIDKMHDTLANGLAMELMQQLGQRGNAILPSNQPSPGKVQELEPVRMAGSSRTEPMRLSVPVEADETIEPPTRTAVPPVPAAPVVPVSDPAATRWWSQH
jgi:hypothetical protein